MKKSLSIGLALLILIMTGISSVFVSADTSQTQLVDNCTGIAPEKAVYSNISITQRENMPEGWLGGWAKKDEDFANATAFYGSNDTEENLMTPGAARGHLTYEVAVHILLLKTSAVVGTQTLWAVVFPMIRRFRMLHGFLYGWMKGDVPGFMTMHMVMYGLAILQVCTLSNPRPM